MLIHFIVTIPPDQCRLGFYLPRKLGDLDEHELRGLERGEADDDDDDTAVDVGL